MIARFLLFYYHDYHILFLISKMLRESAWKKQQSILEEDSNSLSILKKEICKQSQIDASVQLTISQKIEVLKQNATVLAKRLQNEKHKNIELETIITHLRNVLEKEKLQEASFRDSNSFESLAGLENRYKKYQYDLGQLNGKTNRIAQNVEEKRAKINQNRTQRVIDSGIFRNIEKQLIQSELKFKKLLIEKIKHQKEYEKLLKNYEGLKQHAQNYNQQRENKYKSVNSDNSILNETIPAEAVNKKFISIDILKEASIKPKSMLYIEAQHEFQEQNNIIVIKKLLSDTGLENCQELLYHFHNIEQINDRYFNQMMLYAEQSNEIEKYLGEINQLRNDSKTHFYEAKKKPSKNQTFKIQSKKIRSFIDETLTTTKVETTEINSFLNHENFKSFLKCFDMKQLEINQGEQNFDEIKDVLQNLQRNMSQILSNEAVANKQEKYTTSRSNPQEKLQELINKVKKSDDHLNVMKKSEFQEEYHKILKASASKTSIIKVPQKRQSSVKGKK